VAGVAIELARTAAGWQARVTPPHGAGDGLRVGPIELRELIEQLRDHGCHPTDISDAVFATDRKAWKEVFDPDGQFERYYRDIPNRRGTG
jgi:hypothetical protein